MLPELRDALASRGSGVLVAPPGAGKTTLVPLALLEEPWRGDGRIVVLEPRRLAARAAARRMATLLGEEDAGGTVGYRVRMDTRVGSNTRVEVVTEGVLTRMLQSDPALEGVAAVLFDEFHERSLHADLGLAMALQSRAVLRPELRLLVMSATLDAAPVAELLGDAPVIRSEGRAYPVETRWRRRPVEGWIEPAVVRTVRRALERDDGDVLVFLPGAAEIRRTAARLEEADLSARVDVHPLFGNLPGREQDRAIRPSPPDRRKVVLATSIAETSLTIEGVRVVVDSGLMRVPRFDPGTGMSRLETVRVTRDSADQRRGRAGRTAPGVCYRVWTRQEERGLVPQRRPEIRSADLAPLALELAAWGAAPSDLRWLDAPAPAALAQAKELLRELDALDADGAITEHGRRMADIGVHPRLAHMLLRADELGLAPLGCELAAVLGERDFLRGDERAPDADLRLRVEALRAARARTGLPGSVSGQRVERGGLRRVLREADHRARQMGAATAAPNEAFTHAGDETGDLQWVGLLSALAYPDRVARRREDSRGRFLLRNGRGARFREQQPLEAEDWLVAAEVEGRGREARIFRAAPLTLETIERHFGDWIEDVDEVVWDADAERVIARRRRALGAITLAQSPLPKSDPYAVARALLEAVRDAGLHVLPWSRSTGQLRDRLEFLHRVQPDAWPSTSDAALERELDEWLLPFMSGMKTMSDLSRLDLKHALLTRVDAERRRRLDTWAPTHLEVPSGSRIAIDYSNPEAPALAARIQELFGMVQTPRLASGRVPLTVRLLSPAMRPVQVTTDLENFWRATYFEVRKDLRGRYPKHYWPDDPLNAQAIRGVRPKD